MSIPTESIQRFEEIKAELEQLRVENAKLKSGLKDLLAPTIELLQAMHLWLIDAPGGVGTELRRLRGLVKE